MVSEDCRRMWAPVLQTISARPGLYMRMPKGPPTRPRTPTISSYSACCDSGIWDFSVISSIRGGIVGSPLVSNSVLANDGIIALNGACVDRSCAREWAYGRMGIDPDGH